MEANIMHQELVSLFSSSKIIPILYDLKYADYILKSDFKIVIMGRLLNVMNLERIVSYFKSNSKVVIADLDLIKGLSTDEYAIKYLSKKVGVDGLITTRASMISEIKKEKMISILKVFCYDEFSLESALKNINYSSPDILEVLPAVAAPFFVKKIKSNSQALINVAGFLDDNPQEILKLFKLGISAVHTGNQKLWQMFDRI